MSPHRTLRSRCAAAAVLVSLLAGCEKPVVSTTLARRASVEATVTSVEAGVVKAARDSILSTPASGRIVEVLHRKGDRVQADEPIIRLENDLERIAVEEAQVELDRLRRLEPEGIAAKDLIDRARFALERAKVHYERTFVRAPFDGLIVELNANLGEMSYGTMPLDVVLGGKKGNSAESLVRLVDDSTFFVEADVDEADAGSVRAGQEARLTIDALGGEVLRGVVSRVSPAVSTAELSSRTVRVEVEVKGGPEVATGPGGGPREGNGPPAAPPLSVGMSADVEIILDRVDGVLTVPTLVILEEGDEKTVFVVEAGKLSRRRVVLGVANWERSEIRDGLAEGDRVVIPADRAKLIEGLAVECAPTEEPGRG